MIIKDVKIRRIQRESESCNFSCGNPSIETLIKKSYYSTLLQEGYACEILCNDTAIGYFMYNIYQFKNHDNLPRPIDGVYSDLEINCSAFEIKYLAIQNEYQHSGIGTHVLKMIIQLLRKKISEYLPVRFIIIEALTEKVDWYKKFHFIELTGNESRKNEISTKRMFIDCHMFSDEFLEYIGSKLE